MYVNEFRLLHIISIEKRRKRSIKTIHLKQQTGNMMPKQIRLFVLIIEDCILRMSLIEKINMGLNEHLKYTNLKIVRIDRKSTRLNSSHVAISYAVFCLKSKK